MSQKLTTNRKFEKGRPLPKFGEWDVNDPASAEGFTVIFNKARDEKKTGGKPESPGKVDPNIRHGGGVDPGTGRPSSVRLWSPQASVKEGSEVGKLGELWHRQALLTRKKALWIDL
uniref:Predicted uncharacterized protein 103967858 isoform X1 n=1 Tax=Malus domestica TaxID=3750 RepID=A0A4Y1QC85_MALDO|nr:predicted uncharacterized protein 103967858 isoform X1 [Malus domestica]